MRIQELEIDRFGVWQDIKLPLNAQGLTVFYGPNEAGKSTLMRFVRGVLYGFQQRDEKTGGPDPKPVVCEGALRVEHGGSEYRLHRVSVPGTRGRLEINGRAAADNDPQLQRILGNSSEALFENIFAIGLHELQQLATLNGEDVARHIYSLSLGPDGERILRAQSDFDAQRHRLLAADHKKGEILDLLKRLDEIDQQLERLAQPGDRHSAVLGLHQKVESDIDSLKRRQSNLQQNLRGLQFLHRAWGPWNKQRELRRVLDQTRLSEFVRPETLDRYDQIDVELGEIERRHRHLVDDSKRLLQQAEAISLRPELEEHGCEIKHLSARSEDMRRVEYGGRPTANQQPLPSEIQQLLAQMPTRWDVERLKKSSVTPTAVQELMKSADRYRDAARGRSRSIKQYKRFSASLQKKQRRWSEHLSRWGSETPAQIRRRAEQRLAEVEDLRDLRSQREQLLRMVQIVGDGQGQRVPELFHLFLLFFTIAGACLLGGGLYAAAHGYYDIVVGGPTAWIAGGCLFCLGLSAMAISRTLHQRTAPGAVGSGDLSGERQRYARDLERINQSIERIVRKDVLKVPHATAAVGEGGNVAEREVIAQIRRELDDLDAYDRDLRVTERLRRTLSTMRQKLQTRQKDLGTRRREWGELLRRMGLDETLKVPDAFQSAGRVIEARRLYDDWARAQMGDGYERRQLQEFKKHVEKLGESLKGPAHRVKDHFAELSEWDRDYRLQAERRKERSNLRQLAKEKHREAEQFVDKIKRLRDQRSSLLAQAGLKNRDELVTSLKALERRSDVERQLDETRRELERIASSEPELAVVEDDLIRFSPTAHEHDVTRNRRDLDAVDTELRGLYESLGHHKRELRAIEDDRSGASLRFERAQLVEAIREATERWSAVSLADDLVAKLRERVEKTRQPDLLRHASDFLRRLTCGRYHNIWTPLGERRLVVDEKGEQSLRIEQLSSGTREQVFLAIRMAMIRSFAEQGTVLPMVLDDVTVNFDQTRTEAAVGTLVDLAEQGQQVLLFTCHLHLSHIFQNHGIEPVWLPGLRDKAALTA